MYSVETWFTADGFLFTLALISVVIIVSALLSGLVEKSGLPQVAVFLLIGAIAGPLGLGLVNVSTESPILRIVSTISLTLVLFTDAVSLKLAEVRRHAQLAAIVLGPGTILSAGLIGFIGWWILGLSPAAAAIIGAALASTDPVLLRALLRRRNLDTGVRQALRLESGLNDAVLLPIILISMAFLGATHGTEMKSFVQLGMRTLLIGPAIGIVIGLVAIAALDLVRRRIGVRRDYESLYSLGVAFSAFAAAESLHGSGFLAAFAAGMTISALDVELCDCFVEYGETTAEMALLFAFVLFGTSLIWTGLGVINPPLLIFTVAALLARPIALLISLSLTPNTLDWRNRLVVAWYGPRGLSSLLLVLLPVFAGIAGAEQLVPICCFVVLVSIVIHGVLPAFQKAGVGEGLPATPTAAAALPIVTASVPTTASVTAAVDSEMITVQEIRALQGQGRKIILLDVRNDRSYNDSDITIPEAFRVDAQLAGPRAREMKLPTDAIVVPFCSCPNDASARSAAESLRRVGYANARALHGGWDAWQQAGMPVVPKR